MSHTSNRPVDWEALVTQNENRLYRAALAILGDPHEAEDAVQDAFVRFLERAPKGLECSGAWLMRVLVNSCKSRLRLAAGWAAARVAAHSRPGRASGAGRAAFPPSGGPGCDSSALLRRIQHR